jgi:micrococcal nuclease
LWSRATRKYIGIVFGSSTFLLFILLGAAAPQESTMPAVEPVDMVSIQEEPSVAPPEPESVVEEVPIIVNPEYDTGDGLEAQDTAIAVDNNKALSQSPDKKLFMVTNVVDGDTIKISELGTLRLIGIDTPETRDPRKPVQCFGREASNKAKELLSNKRVYLEFDPANRIDKYGRTLAYVYREDGLFYNAEMIKQGYAHSYVIFPHPKLEEFNQYQREARDNNRGLWAENTCNGNTTQAASSQSKASSTPQPSSTPSSPPAVTIPAGVPDASGFIEGSCASLKALGIGNFKPGDPNYTAKRDGDNDGIACEMN